MGHRREVKKGERQKSLKTGNHCPRALLFIFSNEKMNNSNVSLQYLAHQSTNLCRSRGRNQRIEVLDHMVRALKRCPRPPCGSSRRLLEHQPRGLHQTCRCEFPLHHDMYSVLFISASQIMKCFRMRSPESIEMLNRKLSA